jgi:hypothetical protein
MRGRTKDGTGQISSVWCCAGVPGQDEADPGAGEPPAGGEQEHAPPAGAGHGQQGPQHQHRPHLPQPAEHQQGNQPTRGH